MPLILKRIKAFQIGASLGGFQFYKELGGEDISVFPYSISFLFFEEILRGPQEPRAAGAVSSSAQHPCGGGAARSPLKRQHPFVLEPEPSPCRDGGATQDSATPRTQRGAAESLRLCHWKPPEKNARKAPHRSILQQLMVARSQPCSKKSVQWNQSSPLQK